MSLTPAPILETERLILRIPESGDFDAWAAFAADEETMRHIGGVQARSVAWRGICSVTGAWAIRGFSMLSVIEKATGRWVGRVGPWQPDGWPGTEVGWGIIPEAHGQGYATESAAASMDWAIANLGWTNIIHCIDRENAPSQGVARRLGSMVVGAGFMPAPFDDHEVEFWGQNAEQWKVNRQRVGL